MKEPGLRLGFDLDGVVASQDIALLQMIRALEDNDSRNVEWVREWYYRTRRLLLEPSKIMASSDLGFIITCRQEHLRTLTELWCRRFVPNLKLLFIPAKSRTCSSSFNEWCEEVSLAKAKAIRELRLDVYFEDVDLIVERLRKLVPECKVLKFGEDLYEGI